jgi:hypothetical protein
MGSSWFKKHLNWTWVISALICILSFSIIWGFWIRYPENIGNAALWVLLPAHAVTLRMKNRSGWWMPVCFFIWFLPLCLSNKTVKENENGNTK